jgi:hypothetical protein
MLGRHAMELDLKDLFDAALSIVPNNFMTIIVGIYSKIFREFLLLFIKRNELY